jgi:hypothetical protein
MADISKCSNENCSMKQKCLRYTVDPNKYHQSYTLFIPKRNSVENFNCELFLKDERVRENFGNRKRSSGEV